MRRRALIWSLLLACTAATAPADIVSDYQKQTEKLSHDAVFAELEKHPERWDKLSMKIRFRIDANGRVHDVRILSGVPNHWAEQTARRALGNLKLPPVPKEVMQAAGMDGCNTEAEFAVAKNKADGPALLRAHNKLHW